MKSYEAARSLYSFLGFCAWAVIIIGALIAFAGMSAMSQMRGFGASAGGLGALTGALPGMAMALVGFVFLALVQIGRAVVDTAEYTQQMLKIARDQLDVSRQGLNQGKAMEQGFAALKQSSTESPSASFADASSEKTPAKAPRPQQELNTAQLPKSAGTVEYQGKEILLENGKALYGGTTFDTLGKAKDYVDNFAPRKLPGAHR